MHHGGCLLSLTSSQWTPLHTPTHTLIHTYLGVVPSDLDQQLVDELAHGGVVGVDAGDDLQ